MKLLSTTTTLLLFLLIATTTTAEAKSPVIPQCLAEVDVTSHIIAEGMNKPTHMVLADIDGDGSKDLVVASRNDHTYAWYGYNATGKAFLSTPNIIESDGGTVDKAHKVAAADIDGDGDIDVIGLSEAIGGLAWYANDGTGSFGPRTLLSPPTIQRGRALLALDFNHDDRPDLVTLEGGSTSLVLYANTRNASGGFLERAPLDVGALPVSGTTDLAAGDLDNDHAVDLVVAFRTNNSVYWFPGTNLTGPSLSQSFRSGVFILGLEDVFSIALGDLDGDENLDLVAGPSTPSVNIAYALNVDGTGTFPTPSISLTSSDIVADIVVADIDGDNDMDIVFSQSGAFLQNVVIFHNQDGKGSFNTPQVLDSSVSFFDDAPLLVTDVDQDGTADIMTAVSGASMIVWYPNRPDVTFQFSDFPSIPPPPFPIIQADVKAMDVADWNGDSLLDVVAIYNNDGSDHVYMHLAITNQAFAPGQRLSSTSGSRDIRTVDCNSDGTIDVAAITSDELTCFVNNGDAVFTLKTQSLGGNQNLQFADLDGDGLVDPVYQSFSSPTELSWASSRLGTSGPGSYGAEQSLSPDTTLEVYSLGDFDGDGDIDVVAIPTNPSHLLVFNNTDGLGTLVENTYRPSSGSAVQPTDSALGDLDGDGDLDLLVGFTKGGSSDPGVLVYENDGLGSFLPGVVAISSPSSGPPPPIEPNALSLGDLDGSGTLDVVVAWDTVVRWYSNPIGSPISVFDSGASVPTINSSPMFSAVQVVDIDMDGDLDVVVVDSANGILVTLGLTRTAYVDYHPTTRAYDPNLAACSPTSPTSLSCLRANMDRTSLCVQDTLVLPPATYECAGSGPHVKVTRSLTLESSHGPESTVFECRNSLLFRVFFQQEAQVNPTLTLRGLTIRNMGTNDDFPITGSPGLRVEGQQAQLVLIDTHIESAASIKDVTARQADGGLGGALLVLSGAQAFVINSTFSDCSASSFGGAILVRDPGSALHVTSGSRITSSSAFLGGGGLAVLSGGLGLFAGDVSVSHNLVSQGSGGGVYVDGSSRVEFDEGAQVVYNSAVAGLGGGLFVAPHPPTLSPPSTFSHVTISHNRASLGGGLAVVAVDDIPAVLVTSPRDVSFVSASNASGVVLQSSSIVSNTASVIGGGLLACSGSVQVEGASSATSWSGNGLVASSQVLSGADAFVCPVSGSSPPPLPWLTFGLGVRDGPLELARIHGVPGALRWVTPPPSQLQVGQMLQGVFQVFDVYGSPATYGSVTATLSLSGGPDLVVSSTSFPIACNTLAIRFPDVALLVLDSATNRSVADPISYVLSISGPPGTADVEPLSGSVTLEPCGPGFGYRTVESLVAGSAVVTAGECLPCDEGTFSVGTSFQPCQIVRECNPGSLDVRGEFNATYAVCVCNDGFTLKRFDAEGFPECSTCPEGGTCKAGLGPPAAAPGFYPGRENGTFIACKRPRACKGGFGTAVCQTGYSGYLCNTCQRNYYSAADGACQKCPSTATSVFASGICLLCVIAVLAGYAVGLSVASVVDLRTITFPPSLSILFVVSQVIGLVGNVQLAWTSTARDTLRIFDATNIDLSLFASECSLASFHTNYALGVILPIVGLCLSFLALVLARVCVTSGVALPGLSGLEGARIRTLLDAVVFTLAPLLYIPVAKASFILFDCSVLPNGDIVVDADPGVACFSSAWWGVAPVGLLAVLGYVVGLPVYCAWSLSKRREKLLNPATYARFGSLYKLYRTKYYWAGVVDLAKRLVVVIVAVFASDHVIIQILVLLTVFVVDLGLILSRRPFFFPRYNDLSTRVSIVLLALLILGSGFHAERDTNATSTRTALTICVVAVIVVFVGLALYAIARDILLLLPSRKALTDPTSARSGPLVSVLRSELPDLDVDLRSDVETLISRLSERATSATSASECASASEYGNGAVQLDDLGV